MHNTNKAMPTNQGLQQYSMGINKDFDIAEFETLPFVPDSETGEPIPDMGVKQAKDFVDNGNKL